MKSYIIKLDLFDNYGVLDDSPLLEFKSDHDLLVDNLINITFNQFKIGDEYFSIVFSNCRIKSRTYYSEFNEDEFNEEYIYLHLDINNSNVKFTTIVKSYSIEDMIIKFGIDLI